MFRKTLLRKLVLVTLAFCASVYPSRINADPKKSPPPSNEIASWPVKSFKHGWGVLAKSAGGKVFEKNDILFISAPYNKQYFNFVYVKSPWKGTEKLNYAFYSKNLNNNAHSLYVEPGAEKHIDLTRYQKHEYYRNMVLKISDLKSPPTREGIEIKEVTTKSDFNLFKKLVSERTRIPLSHVTKMFQKVNPLVDKKVRMYVAYFFGSPAGTTVMFDEGKYVSLYWIGVQKPYRQNGIGTALTIRAVKDAQKCGHEWVAIQSSVLGSHVYPRLGFKDVGGYTLYFSR